MKNLIQTLKPYFLLMRWHRPIGFALLFWPTAWALWLANQGMPSWRLLIIFMVGTIVTRSAGCIINDIADRDFDPHVERTAVRPLASGALSLKQALRCLALLGVIAFTLACLCNPLTIELSFIGVGLAAIYPYLKRVTHLPQCGLGLAFSWGVPMAFAATLNAVPLAAWFLFASAAVWPLIYDTMYAMSDRSEDLQIGVKSTAILFGAWDKVILAILQILFLSLMMVVGNLFQLNPLYYVGLMIAAFMFTYQQYLIRHREAPRCMQAFLHNHWVGMVIWLGLAI